MEIFQTIWTALTTPNMWLINLLSIPLTFLEITVSMLLFTTVLNLTASRKKKILYIVCLSIWTIFTNILIPKPLGPIINMILLPFIVYFVFRATVLKSILAELIPTIIIVVLEAILTKISCILFKVDYGYISSVAVYRVPIILLIYLTMFLLYKFFNKVRIHSFNLLEVLDTKSKILFITNFVLALISMGIQFYLIVFYNDNLPMFIIILSLIALISYFVISIFSLIRTTQLKVTTRDLEQTKQYNRTLSILHDNIRAFRHDFQNIVQTIGRICSI
ncbi:MAG: hypothetical protein ACLUD1_12080 [Clostridia bacterium]